MGEPTQTGPILGIESSTSTTTNNNPPLTPQQIVHAHYHNDNSPFPTGGVTLDESNYSLWSQIMEMRIGARNKAGYLTGSAAKPAISDVNYDTWVTDNHKVKSWLIDSMSPSLMKRFIRLSTAKEIWEAISKTFYDGSDKTKLFELNRKSFTTRQDGRPLATYYNELVAIFQEIDHRNNSQEETVADITQLGASMARLRVHIFLSGLDSEYDQVRGEILRKDPEFDLESSYAYVRKEDQQRKTMGSSRASSDSTAMAASRPRQGPPPGFTNSAPRPKPNNFRPGGMVCHHCGEPGHSKYKCYEIVGYPEWWDFTKKPRKNLVGKAAVTTIEPVETSSSQPATANVAHSGNTGHPHPEDSWLWC